MTFYDFGNIVSLVCIIAGLLLCFFRYVELPTKGFRYLIGFFLALFMGEYYWTVYVLVMKSDPEVSNFVSYLGWNIAIVFLLISVLVMRNGESKSYRDPFMFLPVVLNIPQFYLYITHLGKIDVDLEGFLNNLWQVGITTAVAVLCMQELLYYYRVRRSRDRFPWIALIIILYLTAKYAMWTVSCFSFNSEFTNPYHLANIACSVLLLFFAFGAGKYYGSLSDKTDVKTSDDRPKILLQTVMSLAIAGICIVGFLITLIIRDSKVSEHGSLDSAIHIVIYFFAVSAIVVFLVLVMLFLLTNRYRRMLENCGRRSIMRSALFS